MTNTKKYYWLKLKEDFFEEDAIAWIEEQENGKDYCLFYLKLCLKSLKTNGLLIRNVGSMLVPYDAKTLAKVTNTDIDTVKVAMEIFTRIGLVQILENGEIFISQLQNMVGSETKWAEKKRLQRQKKDNVPLLSGQSPIEIEKEQEKEKEIEIEIEQQHRERGNEICSVVVEKINEYFNLEKDEIKIVASAHLATGKDISYLIEKLELVKNTPGVKSIVGFLLKAIENDYKVSMSKDDYKKTKFHNFDETFTQYESNELDEIIAKGQVEKWKDR